MKISLRPKMMTSSVLLSSCVGRTQEPEAINSNSKQHYVVPSVRWEACSLGLSELGTRHTGLCSCEV